MNRAIMSQSPILLSATLAFTKQPTGMVTVSDPSLLQNVYQQPMFIDEIRFGEQPSAAQVISGSKISGNLRVKFDLGSVPLTNGYVPWEILFPTYNNNAQLGAQPNQTATQPPTLRYVWRFPKPLYVPAGSYIMPRFITAATGDCPSALSSDQVPFNLEISYAGRSLPKNHKPPKALDVPWATSFIGAVNTTAGVTTERTREPHLCNPFFQPLSLQRMTAFIAGTVNGGNALKALFNGTNVRMVDSFGRIIVRDPTPFAHLFHSSSRSWWLNCTMPPKSFYLATLESNFTGYTSPNLQNLIGLVGSRQVNLNKIAFR